ncbi:MAG TPA: ATP-binding protein, partial [Solirubrobacteraceae bacterium]
VTIATDHFDAAAAFAPLAVGDEVRALEQWLCAGELGERSFQHEFLELARSPPRDTITAALSQLGGDEAVVLYVTGHGATDINRHQIVLSNTNPSNISQTAYGSADLATLVARLEPSIAHVLLIIDLCQAGHLAGELATSLQGVIPRNWIVLLSTGADEPALLGAFTSTVTRVIDDIRAGRDSEITELEPYLGSDAFIKRVMHRLDELYQQDLIVVQHRYRPSVCLPNPRYRDDRVKTSAARRDLAILQEDMAAHWQRRAPVVGEPWVFMGRATVMQRLIAFASGPPGVLVVTGRAGSGKSAVLARLVTCSDPEFRAQYGDLLEDMPPVPPQEAVAIAVLATGKSPLQIAAQIGRALGAQPYEETLEAWLRAIEYALPGLLTVVVDAVDEASDPLGVIRSVLEPLRPRLRIIVGVRSAPGGKRTLAALAVQALRAEAVEVDGDQYWEPEDLRKLIRERLADGSDSTAALIADGADRSYLLAMLVADEVAARDIPTDSGEISALLAGGITEVVRRELIGRDDAIAFLRATALAFGRGLPWRDVWPAAAARIAPAGVEVDVEALLRDRIAGYLVRDLEDGVTVYRPFHDALRASLAGNVDDYASGHPSEREAHERIAGTLLPRFGRRQAPPDYARRHLAEHAAAADQLNERFINLATLPYLEAGALSRTLRLSEATPHSPFGLLLGAWRGVRHRWTWDHPTDNAAALDMAMTASGQPPPEPATPWRPLWAEWAFGGTVVGDESELLGGI